LARRLPAAFALAIVLIAPGFAQTAETAAAPSAAASTEPAPAAASASASVPPSVPPVCGTAEARAGGAAADRPRIGLVLSGGGARGGAHAGVIKALDELRVPIDCIAGVSAGAAIGGLYASGLTPDGLEEFLSSVDWDNAFRNATPRRLRSFRRKRDDDLFLVSQKPGLNNGTFQLPAGIVQGQVIETILSHELMPVHAVRDFDHLAIPFRAVAGDLATGEAVVLDSGDLSRAIRASMAVPAAFSPVRLDGRLLVDGGIVMNLPVEVAKAMGADIVIASDVTQPLEPQEDINSIVDVTAQLTNLLTYRGAEAQKKLLTSRDLLFRPTFSEDFSSVNFNRITETIQSGYDTVMARRGELADLALDPQAYAAYKAALPNPREAELPTIDFVHIDNPLPIADSVIEDRIKDIDIGAPLDFDSLDRALNKVYGLELFQNVRYQLVEEDGETGIELDLVERSWGPNYIQLGVQYSSSSEQDALFGLAASYLRTEINPLGGEWRATFFVGDEPAMLADLYQPFGSKARYFIAPSLLGESKLVNIYEEGMRVTELQIRQAIFEVGMGREIASWGEFRGGFRLGRGQKRLRVGDPAYLTDEDFRTGEFFARFSADTLDNVSFPREGVLGTAEWRGSRSGAFSADYDFDQLLVEAAYAKTWGRHTLLTTLRYDATISGVTPPQSTFRFGGFFDLGGLNANELSGQNVVRIGASFYRRIADLLFTPAFAGISVEVGNAWDNRGGISWDGARMGGSIWAGVDTPIGPIYLAYGIAEGDADAVYVILGRVF
jgi:NTE family protein